MAEDILGKAVRIDEKEYVPKGAKLEVWTKGRHKYLVKHLDPKGIKAPPTDTIRYLNGEKISASLSDDEVIKAFIEESERISIAATAIQVKPVPAYKVIQDPYSDEPPKRVYGDGKSPYYLNNGCKIFIEWRGFIPNPEFVLGTFSTAEEAKQASGPGDPDRLLSKQLITSDKDIWPLSSIAPFSTWIVPTGEVNASLQPVSNYRDSSSVTSKKITIYLPDGFTENGGKGYLIFAKNEQIRYSTDTTAIEDTNRNQNVEDSKIIERVIELIKRMVKELHGIADYDLKLCSPDSEACKLIEYKSPLEPPNKTPEAAAVADTPLPNKAKPKIKFNIEGLPEAIEVKAKEDLPTFIVWAGSIPKPASDQVDDFEDSDDELDPEYIEGDYKGLEETGMTFEAWALQDDVAGGQQDSDSKTGPVGEKVDIKPVSSFDALIDLAGKCARELGKDAKVTAAHMKQGYDKDLHGLCPQGTQAVLYALTGVKAVGQLSGNADHFSFGPTHPTSTKRSSFATTGYFNDKVKVTQINSSWKGTYLTDKTKWQVGDVIAMAYTAASGKNYGHIQVWTGYYWMSDFKQNAIQQRNVEPESVALWRMNDKGLAAVKKQTSSIA